MAYGTLAVDYITYTSNSNDTSISLSGLVNGNFPNLVTTGTVSGVTLTGTSGNFVRVSGGSGLFTTGITTVLGAGQTSPVTTVDVSGAYAANINAVNALNITCSSGNYFTKTISSDSTFTVSAVPSGRVYSFTLEVTHTAGTITWFSGVRWPNSTAPTLTTGRTHFFMFVTDDNGTKWFGSSLTNYTT